ncbi:hypothetical protein FGO68_gene8222 [Halteria grandinella]|uniref:Uncharacterized protein n=1 Tax=Halteria grandinella TaxID=5974 RepID=A0A8J8NZM1_HALGN|nr:hypothetical protein FGO68_gene8222 [Halteria grandinella]
MFTCGATLRCSYSNRRSGKGRTLQRCWRMAWHLFSQIVATTASILRVHLGMISLVQIRLKFMETFINRINWLAILDDQLIFQGHRTCLYLKWLDCALPIVFQ